GSTRRRTWPSYSRNPTFAWRVINRLLKAARTSSEVPYVDSPPRCPRSRRTGVSQQPRRLPAGGKTSRWRGADSQSAQQTSVRAGGWSRGDEEGVAGGVPALCAGGLDDQNRRERRIAGAALGRMAWWRGRPQRHAASGEG